MEAIGLLYPQQVRRLYYSNNIIETTSVHDLFLLVIFYTCSYNNIIIMFASTCAGVA